MRPASFLRAAAITALAIGPTSEGRAQIESFRVSEIDPTAATVEIWNSGAAHVTSATRPFCHRLDYATTIPGGTAFAAGEYKTFSVTNLNAADSDFWLYVSAPFTTASNIVHGMKYGPAPNVGRTGLASGVGLWPGADRYAPAPPPGATLAYDGFGYDPADWYVDETPSLGAADVTTPGTVPAALGHPAGTQTFEDVSLGDLVTAIDSWVIVNTSTTEGIFTARVVNDVLGDISPRESSTRWIRVRDEDAGDVQNRFYTIPVDAPKAASYTWAFWINLEAVPPNGAATRPRIMIQHDDGGFANAWGIELTNTGGNLVVTGIGGPNASAPLFPLVPPTGVGDWIHVSIFVDLNASTISGRINDGTPTMLPIDLSQTADASLFRFCYRGEGVGNVNTMLIDDVTVFFEGVVTVDEPQVTATRLLAPAPNPMRTETAITFMLASPSEVRLSIFDAGGRIVRTLIEEPREAGIHTVRWDGRQNDGTRSGAGIFFTRLETRNGTTANKLLVLN